MNEKKEDSMKIRAIVDEKYYDETPTVKIYAGVLESTKHISQIVKSLNELSPIPSLKHLKRVKRHEGKSYVILDLFEEDEECPAKRIRLDGNECLERLKGKGFDYEKLGVVGVEIADVPKLGPLTRAQYDKAMLYWPVNFHPEKKLETMLSDNIFEESEHKHHLECMRYVLEKSEETKKNTALVVDFVTKQFIATGVDKVENHPLQHAIMVAVDAVASTHKGGAWDLPFSEMTFSNETLQTGDVVLEPGEEDMAPYLCTGYDLYVKREPCVMCAMSLVHSRIKRVFFHVRDPEKGALVSKCQIHTIRDLNHHYDVFEIIRGTDAVDGDETVNQKNRGRKTEA